jgi:hypothetical protein
MTRLTTVVSIATFFIFFIFIFLIGTVKSSQAMQQARVGGRVMDVGQAEAATRCVDWLRDRALRCTPVHSAVAYVGKHSASVWQQQQAVVSSYLSICWFTMAVCFTLTHDLHWALLL